MLDIPVESILNQSYGITKGYIAENFAAQEFIASGDTKLYSWIERNSEIEFLRIKNGDISPFEIKSGSRMRAKSIQQYISKYRPKRAVKLSAKPIMKSEGTVIENYPLYMAGMI